MATADALAEAALREVVDLHAFFQAWLGGTGANDAAAFARVDEALAPDFAMVTPDGIRLARAALVGWLAQSYAARAEPAPFRIAIRDLALLRSTAYLVAVSYVEEQQRGSAIGRRHATALFGPDPDRAGRVQWLFLHETWDGAAVVATP